MHWISALYHPRPYLNYQYSNKYEFMHCDLNVCFLISLSYMKLCVVVDFSKERTDLLELYAKLFMDEMM